MATPTTLPATFVAGNVLTAAQMNDLRGAFRILQVVSTTKTDTFVSSSTSVGASADITGLTATITPSSTASKILVYYCVYGLTYFASQRTIFQTSLSRGATLIGVGDAAGNRSRITGQNGDLGINDGTSPVIGIHLDSPATTSATTYKVSAVNSAFTNSSATFYVNRTFTDTDNNQWTRSASFITLMEVSA